MKPVLQPVWLVGRQAWHVFPQDNLQLLTAMGPDVSGPQVAAQMEGLQAQLADAALLREPIIVMDDADMARAVAAARDADAVLLSLTTARMDRATPEAAALGLDAAPILDLGVPVLAFSGDKSPMMALYILPAGVRARRPHLHLCLDATEVLAALDRIRIDKAAARLAASRLIVLGSYTCPERLPDPALVRQRLGVAMAEVSSAAFMAQVAAVDAARAQAVAQEWRQGSQPGRESSDAEIASVARVQVALADLMARESAQAVSVGCLEIMYGHGQVPFCWVLAQLRDRGLPAGCEHDAGATLTMLMLEYLAERPAYMGNLVLADPAKNHVAISHGCSPTRMWGRDRAAKPYRLVHSHSAPPFSRTLEGGSGVTSYVDYGDVGEPVTIARLGADLDAIFVASGRIVECRDTICDRTTLTVEVADARAYVQRATGNHQVLIYGDFTADLKALARRLDLAVLDPAA